MELRSTRFGRPYWLNEEAVLAALTQNNPRLQCVIVLSGQMEIGVGDGAKRMFNPGDILQVEDLTGQGHTTRSVGNRITASVPLAG